MNAVYTFKSGNKIVDFARTAGVVLSSAFIGSRGDYCIGTLPMLQREIATIDGLSIDDAKAVEKELRGIITAGVKALTVVKLGKNVWDFTAWIAQTDIDRATAMIEMFCADPSKASLCELFNEDHEKASERLVVATARYSVDYYMPEPAAV